MKNLFPRFSHIYIEREAYDYPLSDFVLSKFHNSSIIDIKHYKDIFNRPGQDFQTQKASMKLILAKKPEPFLYPVTDMVQGHHISEFYYTTPMLNCLYNCDYCFLQGMYPSGNIVIFVNQDDLQNAIINKIDQKNSSQRMITVSISYNTDLLAMENFFPLTKSWIDFASNKSNLMIEIRTKSSDFASIKNISPNDNVILSWTISPRKISRLYEHNAPPLKQRMLALNSAIEKGWKVRLCFDPVMYVDDWAEIYLEFFSNVFHTINGKKLYDITLGTFRMNKDYFNRIRSRNPKSDIFYSKYITEENTVALQKNTRNAMMIKLKNELTNYVSPDKILIWE